MEIAFANVAPTEHGQDVHRNVKVRGALRIRTVILSLLEIRCPPIQGRARVIQECFPQQNSTKLQFGTKCRAKCNDTGYRLIGPRVRECLSVGRWTAYDQFCVGECVAVDRSKWLRTFFVAGSETTPSMSSSSTSTRRLTTTPEYLGIVIH